MLFGVIAEGNPAAGEEPQIQEEQCSFRPGRGTLDQFYTSQEC